jgi:hypothetical protein
MLLAALSLLVLPSNYVASCTKLPLCCQVTMLLATLSLLLLCLLALLFFKDYNTRSRMQLSERIPGPKALPLLGNFLGMLFYIDSKLYIFVCLAICHESHHGTLRHYDLE